MEIEASRANIYNIMIVEAKFCVISNQYYNDVDNYVAGEMNVKYFHPLRPIKKKHQKRVVIMISL